VAAIPLLLVLPHELGHALTALAFGGSSDVVVGGEPRRFNLQLGRLSVRVRPLNGWSWMWYGMAPSEIPRATRLRVVLAAAAGPFVTLALLACYAAAAQLTAGFLRWFFWVLTYAAAWTFLVTALPIRYGRFFGPYAGRDSDGSRIRRALAGS